MKVVICNVYKCILYNDMGGHSLRTHKKYLICMPLPKQHLGDEKITQQLTVHIVLTLYLSSLPSA